MKSVEFAPAGAMRRVMERSVRAPGHRIVSCLLFAMFVFSACSVLFDSGSVQEPQDEVESDSPASLLAVLSNTTFVARPNPAYVGEEVTFWANATSDVADSLTFRILYDAYLEPIPTPNPESGVSVNVTNTPPGIPGRVVQNFTYNSLGNFTIPGEDVTYVVATLLVYETDNPSAYRTKSISVKLKENSAPVFDYDLGDAPVDIDVPLNLSIQVTDPDRDPIEVFWEFGDGTFATNTTNGTYADRYVNQTHVWSPYVEPGTGNFELDFIANVTLVDSFGNNITDSAIITVRVPPNKAPTVPLPSYDANVILGNELLIFANATDPEGDPLTWTFNYSDGTVDVIHTEETAPGVKVWCNVSHLYDEEGSYSITMTVSDAIGDNQVFPHNLSVSFIVIVEINNIPGVGGIVVNPETPEIDGMIGYIEAVLSIKVMDLDGDVVTASWYIADAVDPIVNVSGGGVVFYNFKQYVNLTEPGTYNVTVVVTDGYEGHEKTIFRTFNVTSNNAPPRLRLFNFSYATGEWALPMEEIEFTIVISDAEEDTIEVMLQFGDDSPRLYFNLTEYVGGNVTLIINHTYELPGVYTVTLWFTDNKIGILNHSKEVTNMVTVDEAFVATVAIWDWWDYTALALLFVVPVLIVVRMVVIKRRILNLESEGLTLEEARIKAEQKRMDELLTNEKGDG